MFKCSNPSSNIIVSSQTINTRGSRALLERDGGHNKLLSLTVLFFEWIEHIHENFCLLSEGKISHWIYLPQLEILSPSWSTNKFVCLSNFYLQLFFSLFFWFLNVHQRFLHIFCISTWLSSFTCRFVHCTFKKFFLSHTHVGWRRWWLQKVHTKN